MSAPDPRQVAVLTVGAAGARYAVHLARVCGVAREGPRRGTQVQVRGTWLPLIELRPGDGGRVALVVCRLGTAQVALGVGEVLGISQVGTALLRPGRGRDPHLGKPVLGQFGEAPATFLLDLKVLAAEALGR